MNPIGGGLSFFSHVQIRLFWFADFSRGSASFGSSRQRRWFAKTIAERGAVKCRTLAAVQQQQQQ